MKGSVIKTKRKPTGAAAMGAGPGRPKGSVNKLTRTLKDTIMNALQMAGGEAYLAQQARENPTAFLVLLGKALPQDVNANVRVAAVPPEHADAVVDAGSDD